MPGAGLALAVVARVRDGRSTTKPSASKRFRLERAVAQDARRVGGHVHDGRFDAEGRRAAVEDEIDVPGEVFEDVLRRSSRWVG